MQESDRGLSEVRSQVLERFQPSGLHELFLFYSPKNDLFVAYVFFRRSNQIRESEASGLATLIKCHIVEKLASAGRGNCDTIKIQVELDSHENVEANFDGDYFLRLR